MKDPTPGLLAVTERFLRWAAQGGTGKRWMQVGNSLVKPAFKFRAELFEATENGPYRWAVSDSQTFAGALNEALSFVEGKPLQPRSDSISYQLPSFLNDSELLHKHLTAYATGAAGPAKLGSQQQLISKATEEAAELIVALIKYRENGGSIERVCEEYADLLFCMEFLRVSTGVTDSAMEELKDKVQRRLHTTLEAMLRLKSSWNFELPGV